MSRCDGTVEGYGAQTSSAVGTQTASSMKPRPWSSPSRDQAAGGCGGAPQAGDTEQGPAAGGAQPHELAQNSQTPESRKKMCAFQRTFEWLLLEKGILL